MKLYLFVLMLGIPSIGLASDDWAKPVDVATAWCTPDQVSWCQDNMKKAGTQISKGFLNDYKTFCRVSPDSCFKYLSGIHYNSTADRACVTFAKRPEILGYHAPSMSEWMGDCFKAAEGPFSEELLSDCESSTSFELFKQCLTIMKGQVRLDKRAKATMKECFRFTGESRNACFFATLSTASRFSGVLKNCTAGSRVNTPSSVADQFEKLQGDAFPAINSEHRPDSNANGKSELSP